MNKYKENYFEMGKILKEIKRGPYTESIKVSGTILKFLSDAMTAQETWDSFNVLLYCLHPSFLCSVVLVREAYYQPLQTEK